MQCVRRVTRGFLNSGTLAFPPPHRFGGLVGLGTPLHSISLSMSSACSRVSWPLALPL